MQNLVIIGGGTAGWITALQAKQNVPNAKITLIKNNQIGIIGTGEAATPHILYVLMDHKEFISKVKELT